MSKLLLVGSLLSFILILSGSAGVAETIRNYQADIRLMRDSSLNVEENITYDFGKERKHGIFRDIPLSYKVDQGKKGMHIELKTVACDGNNSEFKREVVDGNLHVRIGDPDRTVTGDTINYRACNAVAFTNDGKSEIYWNVTGNGWPVAIQHVSANITSEAHVSPV